MTEITELEKKITSAESRISHLEALYNDTVAAS
jgi:hypothetical protein